MATVLIDKLLQAAVKQGASDIHIVVGQPPVFRLHGRMRKLETKVLEADDTMQLMKSIAPERCQRELQEVGSADFGFAFGTLARFRVSIFKQRGFISMVLRQIPNDKLSPEQLGLPESVVKMVLRPRGLVVLHADFVVLSDVEFRVRKGGKEKVRKEKSKNVHAFVIGTLEDYCEYPCEEIPNLDGGDVISYNPYVNDSFVIKLTQEPIYQASQVALVNGSNKIYLLEP